MVVLLSKAVGKFSRKLTPSSPPPTSRLRWDRLRWALAMGWGQPHTHSCFLAHQLLKLGKAQRL